MFFILQNEQDLVQTQKKIVYEKIHQRVECMSQLLLGKDVKAKGTEQEVEAALDRKYQLLRDRLFEDALKLQVCLCFHESDLWSSLRQVIHMKCAQCSHKPFMKDHSVHL